MVVGDTHGDIEWAARVTRIAAANGASVILQGGDFGYWPRMVVRHTHPHHELFLGCIARECKASDVIEWIVIDGNHDDHYELARQCGHGLDEDGLVPLGERVRYAPRGTRFDLAGVTVGTLGGAVSLDAWADKDGFDFGNGFHYTVGWDWFPELEAPKLSDVEHLGTEPVDILLTHEAPSFVDMRAYERLKGIRLSPEALAKTAATRELVSLAAVNTRAPLVVHGHWHRRVSTVVELPDDHLCVVEGLAANSTYSGRDGRSYLFVDIDPQSHEKVHVLDGRTLDVPF